ncbi:HET domain-containing protein [Colletotrichum scovillei]|uniref:HET domain-containing protein n=1 Tax=Colletotrichum scovillei TaxID=1209932 RepID=UPI0015C3F538|nr:HET domain-containing protein [Colletotrichum scovillei]KAF4778971.1 HET domain-containing protein [Colletotrichum scovillei]
MKLIHTQSYQLSEVADFNIPPFAVLSYAPAALFPCDSQQVLSQRTATHFNNTVLQACQKADARGLQFLWFGSVCVDKTSSLGLQHAVSYSFRLLQAATVCFVYLQDLLPSSASLEESWGGCRYWKRSWTLQELIAPPNVEFFDANWNFLGAKSSPGLLDLLQTVTRIDQSILTDSNAFSRVAIGVRLSWAAGREATRAEDAAYSLVGITGVNMSVRYGEGLDQAFARLVKKIIGANMDGSIFAWTSHDDQFARGLLPQSISEFRHLANTVDFPLLQQPWTFDGNVMLNSNGLLLDSHASLQDSSLVLEIGQASEHRLGIRIQMWKRRFVRVNSRDLVRGFRSPRPCRILAARNIDADTKRSSHLDTDTCEYSAAPLGSSPTVSPCILDDDSWSSCSYPEDTLDFEVLSVDDQEVDAYEDDTEELDSQVDIHERTSLSPDHPYQYERDALLRHFSQRQCLLEDDLRSTEDVVRHIRKRHSKPPYCPKCQLILETPTARDEHVRMKICELQHPTRIEGIDGNQLRKITKVMARRPRRSSEAETWARICAVACPGALSCISPYLQNGLGLEVSKVRDYWNDKGRRCIEKYMSGRGVLCSEDDHEKGVLKAFHALTMADLVHDMVASCGHSSEIPSLRF